MSIKPSGCELRFEVHVGIDGPLFPQDRVAATGYADRTPGVHDAEDGDRGAHADGIHVVGELVRPAGRHFAGLVVVEDDAGRLSDIEEVERCPTHGEQRAPMHGPRRAELEGIDVVGAHEADLRRRKLAGSLPGRAPRPLVRTYSVAPGKGGRSHAGGRVAVDRLPCTIGLQRGEVPHLVPARRGEHGIDGLRLVAEGVPQGVPDHREHAVGNGDLGMCGEGGHHKRHARGRGAQHVRKGSGAEGMRGIPHIFPSPTLVVASVPRAPARRLGASGMARVTCDLHRAA